jgi:hypothetical protein
MVETIEIETTWTTSYKTNVVKIYNATGSLARFKKQKYFSSPLKKTLSLLQRGRCSCKLLSRKIGSCTNGTTKWT